MINHARTLLLNISGADTATAPGDEYIPPDFRPVDIDEATAAVRAVLFGPSPDRSLLNVRARQYMTLLHETELAPFAVAFDSRVTYLPMSSAQPICAGVSVAKCSHGRDINIGGRFPPISEETGRFTWTVTVIP